MVSSEQCLSDARVKGNIHNGIDDDSSTSTILSSLPSHSNTPASANYSKPLNLKNVKMFFWKAGIAHNGGDSLTKLNWTLLVQATHPWRLDPNDQFCWKLLPYKCQNNLPNLNKQTFKQTMVFNINVCKLPANWLERTSSRTRVFNNLKPNIGQIFAHVLMAHVMVQILMDFVHWHRLKTPNPLSENNVIIPQLCLHCKGQKVSVIHLHLYMDHLKLFTSSTVFSTYLKIDITTIN